MSAQATTITLAPSRRSIIRQALRGAAEVIVGTHGDLSVDGALISLNPGTPDGSWRHVAASERAALLGADALTLRSDRIEATRDGQSEIVFSLLLKSGRHKPVTIGEDGSRMKISSSEGHNKAAVKMLAATAEQPPNSRARSRVDDDALQHAALTASCEDGAATARSTDKYQVTTARLAVETNADMDILLPGTLLRIAAAQPEWDLTVTRAASRLSLPQLRMTVTVRNPQGSFPPVQTLYTEPRAVSRVATRPRDLVAAIESLGARPHDPLIVTHEGTIYLHADRPRAIHAARGGTDAGAAPKVAVDWRFLVAQCRAVGKRWPELSMSWGEAVQPIALNYGKGIEVRVAPMRSYMTDW